ncbi:MAG: hypothetical protein IT313_04050 [Anaerolineales bacterium]|nr:hypothetical protein [Anaerolineales bacterium]
MSIRTKVTVIALIIAISGFYLLQRNEAEIVRSDTTQKRWRIYERALGLEIAESPDSICEWLILGQNNREVYVWAACRLEYSDACRVRMSYATVFLDSTGGIASVELHAGFQDIATQLPEGTLPVSGSDVDGFMGRVCIRLENSGSPYIIQQGTSLP